MYPPLEGPFAWRGEDMRANSVWRCSLNPDEQDGIDTALRSASQRGFEWRDITRVNFQLPALEDKLDAIGRELEDGCGMVRLTGLPVTRYNEAELRIIWMGICAHLGTPVSQNARGQLMRDICDEGPDVGTRYGQLNIDDDVFLSSRARVSSTAPLRFHTDRTDVVGLLCVRQAKSGGESKLASSVAVHNEMLRRRPDLAALLYADIHRSRLGEEEGGEDMVYPLPVSGVRDNKFTSHYSRTYVEAAQLLAETPKLSAAQWEALDLLAELAEELCMEMTMAAGDIQFLNNHVIYHARAAFENDAAQGRDRLLYRIWLCASGNRALPENHAVLWGNVEAGLQRGGIGQTS